MLQNFRFIFLLKSNFVFCAGQKWIDERRGPVRKQKEGLSQSAVVGILVTVILIVTVVAVTIYFVVRNRYSLHSKIFILFAARHFTATCIVTAAVQYVHEYGQCTTRLFYSLYVTEVLFEEFVHLRWLNIHNMANSRLRFTDTDKHMASILPSVTQYFPFISQPKFKHVWFLIFYLISCHYYSLITEKCIFRTVIWSYYCYLFFF